MRARTPVVTSLAAGVLIALSGLVWSGKSRVTAAEPNRERDAIRSEAQPTVDQMMSLLGQGKIDDMLQRMPVAPAMTRDDSEALRTGLAGLTGVAGRYTGYDIIAYQSLGERFHEVYVLGYFEKEPVLFEFGLYRAGASWQVQRFKFKTDIGPFLEALPVQRP